MSKKETTTKAKRYSKSRTEHMKDLAIVGLITLVAGFALGMRFESGRSDEMLQTYKDAQTVQTAEAVEEPVKK